jgi:hypothetical protein
MTLSEQAMTQLKSLPPTFKERFVMRAQKGDIDSLSIMYHGLKSPVYQLQNNSSIGEKIEEIVLEYVTHTMTTALVKVRTADDLR